MILFLFILNQANASGLSYDTAKTTGLTFISTGIFLVICTAAMVISRPSRKGILSSLIHMIIFMQFTRYTSLIDFDISIFYYKFFYDFSQIQDPYELFEKNPQSPWMLLRFESTNFIYNSYAHLFLISFTLVVWYCIKLFIPRYRGPNFNRFLVFVVYCSAMDLSISAFIQVKNITFTSAIGACGSTLAIFYLACISIIIILQVFYIYKTRYDSWIIAVIIEEYTPSKNFYYYLYFPLMIIIKILYVCLIVFTLDKPYTVPIVISISNLILCNTYSVSYLVSIRPFINSYDMIIVLIELMLEIIFLFFPVMYSMDSIPDLILDCLCIGISGLGLIILQLKAYYNSRDPRVLTKIHDTKKNTGKIDISKDISISSSVEFHKPEAEEKVFSNGFMHTFKENPNENLSNIGKKISYNTSENKKPEFFIMSEDDIEGEELGATAKFKNGSKVPSRDSSRNGQFTENVKVDKNVFNRYKNTLDVPGRFISGLGSGEIHDEVNRSNYLSKSPSIASSRGSASNFAMSNKSIEMSSQKPRVDLNKFTVKTRLDFS
ncbi:hypothetical protein SteCoe_16366 [Stentor coeruleus]|uniref:Uncharacterized protein n=1 Tax=Stentor coeruleus TaxID=5963 RepID=A0A1R2C1B2_9CILI|nr:hypothetical protein SteCoe_16366 [Stentor coeruleus]